jgi:hypothetical protein
MTTGTRLLGITFTLLLLAGCVHSTPPANPGRALKADEPIRGWTLLSDIEKDNLAVLAKAREYDINHVQLSHDLIHELRTGRSYQSKAKINRMIDAAHNAGVAEVVVWDHVLYNLEHYPWRFRTAPNAKIDLDNPAFWEWFKADYRHMLDSMPGVNGVVLTFIESEERIEQQYSTKLKTRQEKLAASVNAVAEVVIKERGLSLYARTFAYTYEEFDNILGAVKLFDNPDVRIMVKEVPHDFFLTHPNDLHAGTIGRPTLVEFDAAGEYNGQGIIAGTWPQYMLRRWKDLGQRKDVIGYVARVDRYKDTRLIGTPGEINLYALKRGAEDPNVSPEAIYDEFITAHYGAAALPEVKAAFKNAYDIVSSSLYTLGTVVSNHSGLNYDPYTSSFVRLVSGKWLNPPTVKVEHGVDREFHYWSDVVNHIAPAFVKASIVSPTTRPATTRPTTARAAVPPPPKLPKLPWPKKPPTSRPAPVNRWDEVPDVRAYRWVTPGEAMDAEYLKYIVTEKNYGVKLAEQSLAHIEIARPNLSAEDYDQLYHYFARTLLTARLHRAVASAYYGFRVYARGFQYQTSDVIKTTSDGLREIEELIPQIRNYPVMPAKGQWDWKADADMAETYFKWITRGTWPRQSERIPNPQAGVKFPYAPEAALK